MERNFIVTNVKSSQGQAQETQFATVHGTVFHNKTPVGAAKKAASKIFRSTKQRVVIVSFKEEGKPKAYHYQISRVKEPTVVMHGGKPVTHNFVTKAKAIKP